MRQDVEDALIGHAQEGGGPGYGEYAIADLLGPSMDETRSPFDVPDDPFMASSAARDELRP
jgi:hypothetical protein